LIIIIRASGGEGKQFCWLCLLLHFVSITIETRSGIEHERRHNRSNLNINLEASFAFQITLPGLASIFSPAHSSSTIGEKNDNLIRLRALLAAVGICEWAKPESRACAMPMGSRNYSTMPLPAVQILKCATDSEWKWQQMI
jgi:hypothetical protein